MTLSVFNKAEAVPHPEYGHSEREGLTFYLEDVSEGPLFAWEGLLMDKLSHPSALLFLQPSRDCCNVKF